ncbi:AraC family transcriptional regulator [Agrilutibacter solisilvae]|uniref:AraC family transcriptional regulator ligand-binding domain-containing protein n=1 Tax=Agrilutibacter solisilvae TaxID=2763317 RepID=A0A974XYW8_9GAMM|nr:AraC family transcriptional regulator [Lysobacter solisilvae]QSX77495.1 AraC family transcriptional regulator ligand-binding domain-containing protein [Lysobacter solisilvae]
MLGRVASQRFCDLVSSSVQQLGDPAIGLKFGGMVGGNAFGLLGVASATAETLADVIRTLSRMESLTSTLGQVSVVRDAKVVHLRWKAHGQPPSPAVVEGILAGWASFGRYLLGANVPVRSISFCHDRRASSAAYEDALACDVRFNARWNALTVATDLLDARTRFFEPRLHNALWRWSDASIIVASAASSSLVRRVVDVIDGKLPWSVPSESEIARELGMSCRNLQRRLHCSGLTYRRLLECVRGKVAIGAMMNGSQSFVRIAERIGYAEQASFCRSFRRWAGIAPSEFTRALAPHFFALRTQTPPTMG